MKKISLFGLGNMGVGAARNLLKAGFDLTIYNRTADKAAPFAALGARIVATPAEAARGAEAIISIVGDDEASRSLWLGKSGTGEDGALGVAPAGCIFVECSTLSVEWVLELDEKARAKGCHVVDAGLGGGPGVIATGTIPLFVGAEPEVFSRIEPVLAAFSKDRFHFGTPGMGMAFKLINNMMIDVQLNAMAEGLALAQRAGLDMGMTRTAIEVGATASPIVKMKIGDVLAEKFEPAAFALKWMKKDAHYIARFSGQVGLSIPVADAARGILDKASAQGLDEKDWIALASMYA
ncbi:MAG: 3-hydroxyisobutyrate dehydrogenase [Spirochaetes bacterium]|nr:MAG: 3-hydroxyisobutyrate dehydrogenase [Spirochaetota bacterium]